MRRLRLLTLVWAVVAPAFALAQSQGAIIGSDGDDLVINADECATTSTTTIDLAWWVSGTVTSGVYRVYATNKDPSTGTGTLKTCQTENDTTASPAIYAAKIGGDIVTTVGETQKTETFATRLFPAAANKACTADATIYVCVHFLPYDINNNPTAPTGVASGTLTLSVGKPATPTGLTLRPGDTRLYASWKAGSDGTATKDYLIEATATGFPTRTSTSTTTSGNVEGLVNGTEYSVVVYARTAAGTKSDASAAAKGTPQLVKDFWDVYEEQGGPEQGGCGGPAGPLALLGLAGAAALRRARRQP